MALLRRPTAKGKKLFLWREVLVLTNSDSEVGHRRHAGAFMSTDDLMLGAPSPNSSGFNFPVHPRGFFKGINDNFKVDVLLL